MHVIKSLVKRIDIKQHVIVHAHGYVDIRLEAYTKHGLSGYLDYSVYGVNHIRIKMICVLRNRFGIGLALVKHLQGLYPETEIDWELVTLETTTLYKSLKFRQAPNLTVIRDVEKLKRLKKREEDYKKITAKWPCLDSEESSRRFMAVIEDWNDLHDEIWKLEQKLKGQRKYRRLLKT